MLTIEEGSAHFLFTRILFNFNSSINFPNEDVRCNETDGARENPECEAD